MYGAAARPRGVVPGETSIPTQVTTDTTVELGRRLWPGLQTALLVMGFTLNPDVVEFFSVSEHRHGKRAVEMDERE